MKRWYECEKKLKTFKQRERRRLFHEFKRQYAENWADVTLHPLCDVVVNLKRQMEVAEFYDMHKQSLNRSVKVYKQYLESIYG